MLIVEFIRRRQKARPGATTLQAKFISPRSDCISLKDTFFAGKKIANVEIRRFNFSVGSRKVMFCESNSMPSKVRTLEGSTVFS